MAKKKNITTVSQAFDFGRVQEKVLGTMKRLAESRIGFDEGLYVEHVRKQLEAVDKAAYESYENGSFSTKAFIEKGVNSSFWTYLNNPQTAGLGGAAVTDWQLMASFTNNNVVYTCADRNAMAVAKGCHNFKLLTTQKKGKGITQRSYATKKLTGKSLKQVNKSVGDDVDIVEITDHPLIDLLTYTGDEDLNGFQVWYATQLNLEVFGRAYWYLFRNGISEQGEPVGIRILKSYYLTPIRDLEGIVTSYAYLNVIDGGKHQTVYFDTEEVIDFRYMSLSDMYAGGTSWLRACWGRIGLSSKWSEYQNWLLDNKAAPGVILQQDSEGTLTGDGDNDQEKRLETDFINRVKGNKNGKPIVLPPGVKAIPFGLTPTEMAPLEIVKQLTNEVASAAGLPPELIGGQATYANMEQARQFWREGAIYPRLMTLAQVVNDSFLPLFGDPDIWIEFENPIPEDEVFELQVSSANILKAAEGRAAGDITKDEHRALLGLPPLDDGTGGELLSPPSPAPEEDDLPDDPDDDDEADDQSDGQDPDDAPEDDGSGGKAFDVSALLKINRAVISGKLDRATGINLVAAAFGLSDHEAKKLVGHRAEKTTKAPKLAPIPLPSGEGIAHVVKAFYAKMQAHYAGQVKGKSLTERISDSFRDHVTKSDGLPDEFVPLDAWTDDLDHQLQPLIEMEMKTAANGRTKALTRIGASPDVFSVVPRKVKEGVQKASLNLASSTISTTTKSLNDTLKQLRQQLNDGLLDGDPVAALKNRVQQVFEDLDDDHAELIARTEASRAVHNGQQIAAQASGIVKGFKFLLSDQSCDECQQVAEDTPEIPVDGSFGDGSYDDSPLPVHPNCRCTMQEIIDFDALSAGDDEDEAE